MQQQGGVSSLGQTLEYALSKVFLKATRPRKSRVVLAVVGSETAHWDQAKLAYISQKAKCQGVSLFVIRWHFNKTLCACLPFWYGGCDANANRFITENECFETCGTSSKSPQPSTEHHVEVIDWYFDTIQSECSRFWYGGCGGNGNRFETQEDCEGLCLRRNSTHINSYQTNSSTRQCTVNLDVNRRCKFRLYVIRSVFVIRICCTVCLFPLT
uniref:BPTI/Kunitz inhibitor domain-containing protein n=1 Tax=Oncorhynchus tshawytscha TaxID=74940 RepID=A0AAZ3PAB1_ONCTS